ncbi:hypothetical protein KBY65_09705 [Cyanobium sp. Alchichica 3B3-8F6]|uniref:hypothetical protein n=1 Tax=Cyanobium sp. Alchichica 3B3-8F6 TaxID=2823696 RepID=UPI0020CE2A19|nr:hypothetical protein [Cyanobium sp. Alchichica 3B3-8F6]MCP9882751.1 hypothetical protein [Cyanobium sp. Alchichica 3B3-8F6]
MAAPRLSASQKIEIVARYRAGEGSTELAEAYGCSANTVSRAVKAALEPAEYEQLKQLRTPRAAKAVPQPAKPDPLPQVSAPDLPDSPPKGADDDEAAVLAIDDADDFGDDASDAAEADAHLDFDDDDTSDPSESFMAVPLLLGNHHGEPAQCQPLAEAPLPASVYMLVDKTVELQAKPLKEFPELGQLPDGEEDRQALLVFANPRQAKRHCGRTQRVIKVPDTRVLERTAPYLIAQGISRVVIEGSLYSLPGS